MFYYMLHFYGRPCNFCSGLTKLSCILYLAGWALLRCSLTLKYIGHSFTKSTVESFFHVFHSCATVTQIGISLLYTKPPKLQQQKTAAESCTKPKAWTYDSRGRISPVPAEPRRLRRTEKETACCLSLVSAQTHKQDRQVTMHWTNTEHNLCYTKDISLLTTGKDLVLKITLILLCYENAHLYTSSGKLSSPVC